MEIVARLIVLCLFGKRIAKQCLEGKLCSIRMTTGIGMCEVFMITYCFSDQVLTKRHPLGSKLNHQVVLHHSRTSRIA